MYLAYARHERETTEGETLASARALLDHGADPNVGYLWHGMPSPFTALTGTFGEGELGPVRQPRHEHSIALARALLAAGADPNDPQALYNRMFGDDDDHLVLLFEFGLGRGNGGPWRERLGDAIDPPAELVRGQLRWAVMHDQQARVRLLLEHGVDADAPFADGRTAIELAALTGNTAVVSILEEHGTPAPRFDDVDAFVAAVLDGDERMALTAAPELVAAGERGEARADRVGGRPSKRPSGRPAHTARVRCQRARPRRRAGRARVGDRAARRGVDRRPRSRGTPSGSGRRRDDQGRSFRGDSARLGRALRAS